MGKKRKSKKALLEPVTIFELQITLDDTKPSIWRRVQVNDCSLDELHEVIQICMGWEDDHMHAFEIRAKRSRRRVADDDPDQWDPASTKLSDLLERGRDRFLYEYDFGDSWWHTITIEKTLPPEERARYPRCMEGQRACPPEDCGGPWGYWGLLEAIRDPDHESHLDMLEWCGEKFDPEAFDLEQVNRELGYLRQWLGKSRGKYTPEPHFAIRDRVRVRSGAAHPEYADIPLGGWAGDVARVARLTPAGYLIRWSPETLQGAHCVYHKRCRRDKVKPEGTWLDEGDLEPDLGGPPSMEPPANIVTRPLSVDNQEDRIRAVFGLTTDEPLPEADQQAQRKYYEHLAARLSFPFEAEFWEGDLERGEDLQKLTITVAGLDAEPPVGVTNGIVCVAKVEDRQRQVPLSGLMAEKDSPNARLIDDYTHWFWEVQDSLELGEFDDDLEEDEDDDLEEDDDDDLYEDFEDDMDEWPEDAYEDEPAAPQDYPVGTVGLYGPDDKTTTKIAASVIPEEGADPILKRWVATDVLTSLKVQREIQEFFVQYEVKSVVMSDGNMGCPHEEGQDFPHGEDCPFCPFWKGKQGSARRD